MALPERSKLADAVQSDGSWTASLDNSNRVEIPVAVVNQIEWLRQAKATASAIRVAVVPLDEFSAVEVFPLSSDGLAATIEELEEFAQLTEAERDQFHRLLASRWEVNIEVRKSKPYRVTLPREARNLDLLPNYPGKVVLYPREQRLEIWKPSEWLQNRLKCIALLSDKIDEFLTKRV